MISTNEKKKIFNRISSMDPNTARAYAIQVRDMALSSVAKAKSLYSLMDYTVGRGKHLDLLIEEGNRAFIEAEQSSDSRKKSSWYARAVLQFADADESGLIDFKEGTSIEQTVDKAIEKVTPSKAYLIGGAVVIGGFLLWKILD